MTSIFVAKLDFGVTSEQLKSAFQEYGTVLKASVATDRETGKSRGFGFVEMADKAEATAAINALDGSQMSGRQIAVKEAEQRPDNRGPRENTPRTDSPREPFRPRESSSPAPRRDFNDENPPFQPIPSIDPIKSEPRKKVIGKDKKGKDFDTDDRNKKTKLSPYKKSGKAPRFMDNDDDDFDPESATLFDFSDEEDDSDWKSNMQDPQEDDDEFEEDED